MSFSSPGKAKVTIQRSGEQSLLLLGRPSSLWTKWGILQWWEHPFCMQTVPGVSNWDVISWMESAGKDLPMRPRRAVASQIRWDWLIWTRSEKRFASCIHLFLQQRRLLSWPSCYNESGRLSIIQVSIGRSQIGGSSPKRQACCGLSHQVPPENLFWGTMNLGYTRRWFCWWITTFSHLHFSNPLRLSILPPSVRWLPPHPCIFLIVIGFVISSPRLRKVKLIAESDLFLPGSIKLVMKQTNNKTQLLGWKRCSVICPFS